MVEYILGNYLVETDRMSREQLQGVIAKLDEVRVKMGLLAVAEGMMTVEQAEEVNRYQATVDKRFGDIAVERGYLSEEQIGNLLKKQGNAYLAFAQELVNQDILKMQDLEEVMNGFQQKNAFTKSEIEDLKSDEPERIVPLFLPPEALGFQDITGVLIRTLIRCVDRHVYMGKALLQDSISVEDAVFQKIVGFTQPVEGFKELEIGLEDADGGLGVIASSFCKEENLDKEDTMDAAGEFLNCVNGLYASALSRKGIDSELLPPVVFTTASTIQEMKVCSIPVYAGGKKAVFVVCGR